jgi:hypothetical protein
MTPEELQEKKKELLDAIHKAEILAFAYARELEVGDQRTAAFEVAENLRCATRVRVRA